jgi:hypothetical protein
MSSFVERVVGAARLDARVYEEVEADPDALARRCSSSPARRSR